MSEFSGVHPEQEPRPGYTDLVVARRPRAVDAEAWEEFKGKLERERMLVVEVNGLRGSTVDGIAWFPQDEFYEVGGMLLVPGRKSNLRRVLYRANERVGGGWKAGFALKEVKVPTEMAGASVLPLETEAVKLVVYDAAMLKKWSISEELYQEMEAEDHEVIENVFKRLRGQGWTVVPQDIREWWKQLGMLKNDLDFVLGMFANKEGGISGIVPDGALGLVSEELRRLVRFKEVSPEEIAKGAANIPSLAGGRVLVTVNRAEAPEAVGWVRSQAKGTVIEGPVGFLDDGGGTRCSLSSAKLEWSWVELGGKSRRRGIMI